jgi:hypothetical protein
VAAEADEVTAERVAAERERVEMGLLLLKVTPPQAAGAEQAGAAMQLAEPRRPLQRPRRLLSRLSICG